MYILVELLQLSIYGIVLGSILTLGAIGVSMIFGILRFAHFAHGDLITVGAYTGLGFLMMTNAPFWFALPAGMAGAAIIAVLIDQTVYKRIRRRQPVILLISSFGIGLILRSFVQIIWGPHVFSFPGGIQRPWLVWELAIIPNHVWIFLAALIIVTLLHLFLTRTRVGKAMRAMSDNMDLALITGIPAERIIMITWLLGGALAAGAGVLLGLDSRLTPTMGWNILLPVFAAAIVGGIGRPYGAIAGGMLIGLAMEISTLFLEPSYKPAVAFLIMVAVLIARPHGIFKGAW
ncbi:branched-chain amino acid ABC transporter permease [Aquisalimonas sp.]|uniref:branched-chain amino acid ABC transporter permease n=1 Tax=Aquisalimonas sp. TaxID=1872621 RepID=UPI0025B95F2B|nr:branched-chain amino acid ABC transporter permease [Aquisalimonas sp.]